MIRQVLAETFKVFVKRFPSIAVATCAIWIPFNLLSYYSTYCGELNQFLDQDGRLYIAVQSLLQLLQISMVIMLVKEPEPGFWRALRDGVLAWIPLLLARFVISLIIILGLLLLVVPGVYMWIRLMYVETVTVIERRSVSKAMARSMELTEGRFFASLGLLLVLAALCLPGVLVMILTMLLPMPDYWLLAGILDTIFDLCFALMIVGFVCGYRHMATPETAD